ncbi:MAG: DUF560 domain-containing protein [Thioclava marina]|uniref:surface lipoprotein assembly modifier n=1 Tax=Thioclava marina TaxID=1915077 RepID=UPI00199D89DE|nr:surface lipoprotein assembly modifier [Thioclava marina]MBC7146015.1 DUF560 domain-containing protein [Thioclava marina]
MRNFLPFKRLWLALSICAGLGAGVPAQAETRRSVTDWVSIADTQLSLGKPAKAVAIFGEIAAHHPDYAPAREGLRRSLDAFGSVRRSEAFLRYALAEDPERTQALLAAWQALDRDHPLRLSASASMLPSNNIDHVASERFLVTDFGTFLINDGGQESSGVGLGFDLALDWVIHPRPGHRVRFRAAYAGAWFDQPDLRYGEPSLALRYEHLGGSAPWALEAELSERRYGGGASKDARSDAFTRSLSFSKAWRTGPGERVLLQIDGAYRSYTTTPYLNGPRYGVELEHRTRLGKRGRLSYGLSLERALPRTGYHRYSGAQLHVGFDRPLLKGVRGGITLGLGERRYDADFPVVGERRRDRTASLGLSAELGRVKLLGQAPKISCTARSTRSNIALYTTSSIDCALSLKLEF